MSKFIDALEQSRHENRRQFRLILVMAAITAFALWGWKTAPRNLTAHIPPDLRNGATIRIGTTPDVPDTTVYTFAFYIWQQVNRWGLDGAKDYGTQIYALQHYLTPSCREQLEADMHQRNRSGELSRRTRSVMEIPGLGYREERVKVLGGNAWTVLLDTQVQETQGNVPVKDAFVRFPLRIVRFDVDREKNRWQLAIDCFGGDRPARLDAKAVAASQTGHTLAEVRTDPGPAVAPGPAPARVAPEPAAAPTAPASASGASPRTATSPALASPIAPATLPQVTN